MRKVITGGIAVTLGLSTALAGGAFAGGNGAWHLWLQPTTASDNNQCSQAAGNANAGIGFANLNAPGKPGSAQFFNGEVSIKNSPGQYTIWLANYNDTTSCKPEGMIVTNAQGNGNWHMTDPSTSSGHYYLVIRDSGGNEVFATQDAQVN